MIGVFDSGIGGLTIYRAIRDRLPQYDYLYLGDNARAPYGDHSQETIYQYVTEALTYLFDEGCILVILACHTASAEALRKIQQQWLPVHYPDRNVLGVTRPLSEAAIEGGGKRIGVIGTKSTIASQSFTRELQQQKKDACVHGQACRLLVPLIEEGYEEKPELRKILKKYLRSLRDYNVDTLILGCTHYGIISHDIKRYMGERVQILDSGSIVSEKLASYLERHPEFRERITTSGTERFCTTEDVESVHGLVQKFLGREIAINRVSLGK